MTGAAAAERARALQDALGGIRLSLTPTDFERHARDFTRGESGGTPLAIAYPADTGEVAQVVRACRAAGLPIVTQGGLTGMAGGAVPSAGCVVLSLERLRSIEELDVEAATITVGAGTPLQQVQEAAAAAGFLFALDLGARGSCTIGGNIATNAGGNRVLRYGMMRDLVLGLEVVLADGTVVTAMNKMLKNNAGYDLRGLFVGSEGTLGVVTRAVLRLHPQPRTTNTALIAVADFAAVIALLQQARAMLGGQLSAFEVMWRDFYTVASRLIDPPPLAPDDGGFFVLLDALGAAPDLDDTAFTQFLEAAYDAGHVANAVVARSVADAQRFWTIRDASGELPRLWGKCVNFDVSIPIGSMEGFVATCRDRLAPIIGSDVLVFGHLADSNLHVAVRDPDGSYRKAIDEAVYGAVLSWSGSISAEHGIGAEKRDYLAFSRSEAEIALMRTIKRTLDPDGLLNPGKVL